MSNVNEISQCGSRYGVFSEHARVTQGIKDRMRDSKNWKFEDDMKESLEMLVPKWRILNGDPDYADSGGYCRYSQLIVNRLEDEAGLKADGARWRSSCRGDAGGRGEA
jgi:hypothetical protein